MCLCNKCGGRIARPGLFQCKQPCHPEPDDAQRIVTAIEANLRDRRGLRQQFEQIDEETQNEIRDTWAELVREALR